jgi:N-carbamoylputrescine amidase
MKPGKIALLHLAMVPGDIDRNKQVIVEAVKHAAAVGAQWIITPELAISGLQFAQVIGTDWIRPQPDAWMQEFCRLVKSLKRTVFLCCPERELHKLYNSVFVISPDGAIIGKHRKIHVASDSLSWSSPGDSLVPVHCDGISVGMLICSDMYTANIAGTLQAKGPNCSFRRRHGDLESMVRMANGRHDPKRQGFLSSCCNRTGAERTLDFWKAPSLVLKKGERLLSHTSDRTAVLTFDWDFGTMLPLSTVYRASYIRG